jgi:hypothetical protein
VARSCHIAMEARDAGRGLRRRGSLVWPQVLPAMSRVREDTRLLCSETHIVDVLLQAAQRGEGNNFARLPQVAECKILRFIHPGPRD